MNPAAQDPLAALQDIQLPAEPGWWPPSALSLMVAAALISTIAALVFWLIYRHRAGRLRRAALQELQTIRELDMPVAQHVLLINQILRRAAKGKHGSHIAALGPQDWQDFLSEHAPEDSPAQIWADLALSHYQAQQLASSGESYAWSRLWLEHNL